FAPEAAGSSGGFLGFLSSTPLAVVGAATAVAVVAAAVGVAGLLGAFTGGSASQQPPSIAAEEPGDPGAAPAPIDVGQEVPDDGTAPGTGADPEVDGPAGTGTAPGAGAADGSDGDPVADVPATTPPAADPPPPADPPTEAALLQLDPLGPVTFVAGVPELVDITVANAGGAASQVSTVFTVDEGVVWDVEAIAGAPTGGGGAAVPTAADNPWTCVRVSPTTARCSLPGLAAGARSTLHASVLVTDDTLDGERDLGVRVYTFAPGQATVTVTTLSARLTSPPARVTTGSIDPLLLTAVADGASTVELAVPVSNLGGTTARDVHVLVDLPADLPPGVLISPVGSGWTCGPVTSGTLDCVLPALAPRVGHPLLLAVTAPAIDPDEPFIVAEVATSLTVRVPAASSIVHVPLTVRPTFRALSVTMPATTTLQRGETGVLTVAVRNTGSDDLTGVTASVDLPAGVFPVDVDLPTDWTCDTPSGSNVVVTCTLPFGLAAGAESSLLLAVRAPGLAGGEVAVTVRADAAATAAAVTVLDVVAEATALDVQIAADLSPGATGTVSVAVANTGRAAAADLAARVSLPRGVAFGDVTTVEGWACELIGPRVVSCVPLPLEPGAAVALDPGAERTLTLPAVASRPVTGPVLVEITHGPDAVTTANTAPLAIEVAGRDPEDGRPADIA
ncbi:MAG TPA: hypothetical protein VN257_02095, partial [Actinotalea sp.]|nr:hypothetical protein [Actinotalea sp.]